MVLNIILDMNTLYLHWVEQSPEDAEDGLIIFTTALGVGQYQQWSPMRPVLWRRYILNH